MVCLSSLVPDGKLVWAPPCELARANGMSGIDLGYRAYRLTSVTVRLSCVLVMYEYRKQWGQG